MTDPIAALVQLRAEMLRIAHEVEALSDLASIRDVRTWAPLVAEKMRRVAMTREMVAASTRLAPEVKS